VEEPGAGAGRRDAQGEAGHLGIEVLDLPSAVSFEPGDAAIGECETHTAVNLFFIDRVPLRYAGTRSAATACDHYLLRATE
jgi:hypothetical protein